VAEPPSYPRTSQDSDPEYGQPPGSGQPRWKGVLIVAIIIALFVAMIVLHITGAIGAKTFH
jgi:hypothetical protein